jgi:hypothetical protein
MRDNDGVACRKKVNYFLAFLFLVVFASLMGYASDIVRIQDEMSIIDTYKCDMMCGCPYFFEYNNDQCCTDSSYSLCLLK